MHILCGCPSYKGIRGATVSSILETREVLNAHGIAFSFVSIDGMGLIDLARSEIVSIFREIKQTPKMLLTIDDDLSWHAEDIFLKMIAADVDVCVAPAMQTGAPHNWNITPYERDTINRNGVRLAECKRAGFALALFKEQAIQTIWDKFYTSLHYTSPRDPRKTSVALYQRIIQPMEGAKGQFWQGEDWSFGWRLEVAGIQTFAAIDVWTDHHGLAGCLGSQLDEQMKERAAQ